MFHGRDFFLIQAGLDYTMDKGVFILYPSKPAIAPSTDPSSSPRKTPRRPQERPTASQIPSLPGQTRNTSEGVLEGRCRGLVVGAWENKPCSVNGMA